jgi:hypothetical protein
LRPFATPDGPCAASDGNELFVACLDDAGEPRWASSFPLAKPGAGSPWFRASNHDGFVLASNAFGTPKLGVVVRLDGTEVARIADEVLAPVARPAAHGAQPELEGAIAGSTKAISLLEPSGALRWSTAIATFGESGRALLDGGTIVVAVYSSIASGCRLLAFDRARGTLLWTGDVLQLPIAHSAYFNEVELERRPGGLVRLSGREAGIRYEQLFEIATGKRVFAEAQMRW